VSGREFEKRFEQLKRSDAWRGDPEFSAIEWALELVAEELKALKRRIDTIEKRLACTPQSQPSPNRRPQGAQRAK
jgi:hypothetical protein